ncbi:MAG: YraN family protein [Ancrocorticia sp.]|jgi:putative endonuclease|nr:YraN family protein [Ancrocorticia sp.]MCI1931993.1 YraN family protein [Ancrocorticia sp.]MCI1963354.1 YraN family protein [Ancrocorticia sp.]MCI2002797.1 YraN family protein [Ancrocorticia sp.]MCI2012120.1 YraN family protein [Ancrocorticia sp.]
MMLSTEESIPLPHWEPPALPADATGRALGMWGESLAAGHLAARGIDILATNWRCRDGELDIVGRDPARDALVAFEVKTRRANSHIGAIESISYAKLRRLRHLLLAWIQQTGKHAPTLAIDLIAITVDSELGWHLHHVEGIA